MPDPAAVKEEIRQRVDLVELVSEHTALKRRGHSFVGLCPFHQEKTPSFSVNAEKQFFKCFGCNAGGDVFTFVQLRESVDFREALHILADRAGVELSVAGAGDSGRAAKPDVARANAWAAEYFVNQLAHEYTGRSARAYVEHRGISAEMVQRFGIGLAPGDGQRLMREAAAAGLEQRILLEAGLCRRSERGGVYETFRDRLMFPIRDTMNRCIGFGGRTLVDAPAKYLNTPETVLFSKSRCLYGLDLARDAIARSGEAIVVEGYTDCIAAHQYGFGNVVATLGTAATAEHMMLLRRYCDSVVLLFDSDAAGEAAADRALAVALKHNLSVRLARVPHGKDPCDYLQHSGTQAFRSLLNSAVDALVFKWNRTRTRYQGAGSAADRRDAAQEFVALISELVEFGVLDAIQQGIIAGQLAHLLSVPAEHVQRLLHQRPKRRARPALPGRPAAGDESPRIEPEQAALLAILRVLVNEPALADRVRDCFDPQRFAEPTYRRVARRVLEWARSPGPRTLADLLSRSEDPSEAELITDLATQGSRMGNYEATLNGAARRLEHLASARETQRLSAPLKSAEVTDAPVDASAQEKLSELHRRLKHRHGFTGRAAQGELGGLRAGEP